MNPDIVISAVKIKIPNRLFKGLRSGIKKTEVSIMARKKTIQEVQLLFDNFGCTILSKEYKGRKSALNLMCNQGHQYQVILNSILKQDRLISSGCKICNLENNSDKRRLKYYSLAKNLFESHNYKLLSTSYTEAHAKLDYICPQGHYGEISYNDFKQGRRCAVCSGKIVTYQDAKKAFSDRGYVLLTKVLSRSTDTLWFICPNGHRHYIMWNTFQQGGSCGMCHGRNKSLAEKEISSFNIKIRNKISSRISQWKKHTGLTKASRINSTFTNKIASAIIHNLGYPQEGMSLDHIVPVSFFDLRNKLELELCWNISNLRYISRSENCARKNNLTEHDINLMNAKQLQILHHASMKPKQIKEYLEKLTTRKCRG